MICWNIGSNNKINGQYSVSKCQQIEGFDWQMLATHADQDLLF